MSSNLFSYKYSMEEWYKTDFIDESDVVVIIDTSRESIWFHSGKKSTARNRSNARRQLNDLIKNYPSYSLKNVSEEAPDDIQIQLEDLREEFFKRKISTLTYDIRKVSNIFFYMSSLASLFLIIAASFSVLLLIESDTYLINGHNHFAIILSNFSFQVMFIALLFLASFLLFILTFLIAFFLRKKSLILYSIIALLLSFSGFFLIRIWDFLIYYEIIEHAIFFRVDVFTMFIVNLNIIGIIALIIGIWLIIVGPKKILEFP